MYKTNTTETVKYVLSKDGIMMTYEEWKEMIAAERD